MLPPQADNTEHRMIALPRLLPSYSCLSHSILPTPAAARRRRPATSAPSRPGPAGRAVPGLQPAPLPPDRCGRSPAGESVRPPCRREHPGHRRSSMPHRRAPALQGKALDILETSRLAFTGSTLGIEAAGGARLQYTQLGFPDVGHDPAPGIVHQRQQYVALADPVTLSQVGLAIRDPPVEGCQSGWHRPAGPAGWCAFPGHPAEKPAMTAGSGRDPR